ARRDENHGVDAGDELRQLEAVRRPRVAVDDTHEEVRREERAKEHDLRRNEEQHPERARIHSRALVRRRRPVTLVRNGGGLHRYTTASACSDSTTTCATGSLVSRLSRPTRSPRR